MKEFMMIFHSPYNPDFKPSPEQMQASIQQWQDWIGGIAAKGNFLSTNALGFEGKTLKPGNIITDGPYAEVKEIIGGYLILKAASIDEAVDMANGCPILEIGGQVEVRDIMQMN